MRELTPKEIDDAPNGYEYYFIIGSGNGKAFYVDNPSAARKHGFEPLPIPRKEIDINISFTKSELTDLIPALDHVEDCGPSGEGWQSDELIGLLVKLNSALEGLS